MHTQIISIIFLFGGVYFPYSDTSSWESNNTIIEDISKAFLKITNETDVLTKLIPEMYDLNVTDPPFVFKLPHKDGAVLIIKRRSDFLDPQFPNLTTSNMQLMNERKHAEVISSDSQSKNPQYIRVDHMEGAGKSDDDWREMGLVGWSGEISQPIELSDLDEMNVDENYYSSEILRYPILEPILSNSMRDNGPRSNKITRGTTEMPMMVTETEAIEETDEGARVYLARVNDPFGYSTSWELRTSSELSDDHEDRPKRDVVRLYSMIKCSTGCEPLLFQGYGCYCGFLGAGFPVDGVDRCCKLHDKCYEHSNCISYLEYFVPYIWKCYRGKPVCAVDHGEWGSPRSCAARLCYCDMRLSRCLRRFECPRQRAGCKSSPVRQLHRFLFP